MNTLTNLSPEIIKKMSIDELKSLSNDIRCFLINSVSKTGGHIGANLGVVELTIALHYVFESPKDKIIFDTGHQGYTHKILTGRANILKTLNQPNGMSRFITRSESKHDIIDASHAGTSLSIASGMAFSNLTRDVNNFVVPVIGDGSLVEGLAFEGLNYISVHDLNLVIVLNDNGMAIAPNIGGIKKITSDHNYIEKCKSMFEGIGINYFSVKDGHNLQDLIDKYEQAKDLNSPAIVHVKTEKGKGLDYAAKHPYKMHFSMPFNPNDGTGASPTIAGKTYATVAAEILREKLEDDKDIYLITPATPYASSLDSLMEDYPDKVLDVGMAEQHAVAMACGMALNGLKPVVCFQTTFLQRAFDQLIHDLCYMNLPVTILGVRSGFAGLDSPTHHGIYDIPYLRSLPNMQIQYPVNSTDMKKLLNERLCNPTGPMIILHPYENIPENEANEFIDDIDGIRQVDDGEDGIIFCLGNLLNHAIELKKLILSNNNANFSVACIRSLKPISVERVIGLCSQKKKVIVMEESTLPGGLGSAIIEILSDNDMDNNAIRIGIDDIFVPVGDKQGLSKFCKIDPQSAYKQIIERWQEF
jgi:1-deoxy-D-xylulose-5-phosphate synthase